MKPATPPVLDKQDFEALAEFRHRLRCFLRFSEDAVQQAGITPQQYMLLLQIKGYPSREWATIGELAQRLQALHHSVVALVSRCEKLQLVERRASASDRRTVNIHLLPAGEKILRTLAGLHHTELQSFNDTFKVPRINA